MGGGRGFDPGSISSVGPKNGCAKGETQVSGVQFVSSYSRALQTREKVGLTLATLLVI